MTDIPNWRQTSCDCDGGTVLREDLEPDSARCTAQAGLFIECPECGGDPKTCDDCEGMGYHCDETSIAYRTYQEARAAEPGTFHRDLFDAAHPTCETCDGDGEIQCVECYGTGGHYMSCDACDEPIDSDSYSDVVYFGDGYIVCQSCAIVDCPACEGLEIVELEPPTVDGKQWEPVAASCSCCGSRPRAPGELGPNASLSIWNDPPPSWGWYSYRARLSDTDGIYFSYLCGDADGEDGCLRTTLDQQEDISPETLEGLETFRGDLDGDDDGLWSSVGMLGLRTP